MHITSINLTGYRNVNFGEIHFVSPCETEKEDNSSKAVVAVDKGLSQNTGLEMLGLINMAAMLAKKNDISLEMEFNKIQSGLSAVQELKNNKDAQFAAKILDTRFNMDDKYNEQTERQAVNIAKDIAFIYDFVESEKFIKLIDEADKARRGCELFQSINIDMEIDGIKGTLHKIDHGDDYIAVPETDDRPGFCYYFPNYSNAYVKITRKLSDNEWETYSYPIHNQERKLHSSYAVKVHNSKANGRQLQKTVYSYAWNKDNNNISAYCTDIKEANRL